MERTTPRFDYVRTDTKGRIYITAHQRRQGEVTRAVDMVGTRQMYGYLEAKIGFHMEVFWELDEAERWLDKNNRLETMVASV